MLYTKHNDVVPHIQRIGCQPEKTTLQAGRPGSSEVPRNPLTRWDVSSIPANGIFLTFFFFFFSFISLIADGPHHYHPACGHKGSSHLSPVHALQFFYRNASSALLQLVNQWLNFTYSRSHAFRYERKNTNPTLVRIELTTSVLADVQLTY